MASCKKPERRVWSHRQEPIPLIPIGPYELLVLYKILTSYLVYLDGEMRCLPPHLYKIRKAQYDAIAPFRHRIYNSPLQVRKDAPVVEIPFSAREIAAVIQALDNYALIMRLTIPPCTSRDEAIAGLREMKQYIQQFVKREMP